MTAITNLYARFAYDKSKTGQPVLIWLHGWDGVASDTSLDDLLVMASWGMFACAIGMRGRDDADGSRDASGREIYDIYDALQYIRANYPSYVSQTKAAIVGYSGGGGNVLAAACKFPDTWNCVVDFYGMSDYGRDGTYGWWQQNAFYRAAIAASVGDTPANLPNNYYARDATAAITNYSGGKLILFHDNSDGIVSIDHSNRITSALDGVGLTNYETQFTSVGDSPRWTHGDAERFDAAGMAAKTIWVPDVINTDIWTIPASGTVTVIGYIKTKSFEITLGDRDDHAATVVYNTATDSYTVTPLTGEVAVTITQGVKTGSATISAETEIIVT